jgi:hypothetical protein
LAIKKNNFIVVSIKIKKDSRHLLFFQNLNSSFNRTNMYSRFSINTYSS